MIARLFWRAPTWAHDFLSWATSGVRVVRTVYDVEFFGVPSRVYIKEARYSWERWPNNVRPSKYDKER